MTAISTGSAAGWTSDRQFLVSDPDGTYGQAVTTLGYLNYSTILSWLPYRYASVTNIDMLTSAQTTLYAVPNAPALSGLKFYITDILVKVNSVSAFVTAPTIKIGKSASYDEYLPATSTSGLDTVGKYTMTSRYLYGATTSKRFDLGDTIKVDVTAGSASALTYDFYVFGIYI